MAYLVVPIEERELLMGYVLRVETEEEAIRAANATLKTLLVGRGYSPEEVQEAYELWERDPSKAEGYSFTHNTYISAWSNWGGNALDVHIVYLR